MAESSYHLIGAEGSLGSLALGSVVGGELAWRDACATAVLPYFFLALPPLADHVAGLSERRETVLVEALSA